MGGKGKDCKGMGGMVRGANVKFPAKGGGKSREDNPPMMLKTQAFFKVFYATS